MAALNLVGRQVARDLRTPHPVFKVLISSATAEIGELLKAGLPASRFQVIAVQPGAAFLKAARSQHPEIAVLDSVHERAETAQIEVDLLKDFHPDVRIIVVSDKSSDEDARIVEQGIFYYTTFPSELVQVVEAAASSLSKKGVQPK